MSRPDELPPIDPRILEPVPRPVLCSGFGVHPLDTDEVSRGVRAIPSERLDLLMFGEAAVAWVTHVQQGWEKGPEGGPIYRVEYSFETRDGELIEGSCGGSFDGLHLGFGGETSWPGFLSNCCDGSIEAFTVLYNADVSVPVAFLLGQ